MIILLDVLSKLRVPTYPGWKLWICSPPFSAHILVSLHVFLDNFSHADVNAIPGQYFLDLKLLLGRVKTSFSLGKRYFLSQILREDWYHVKPEGPGDHMIQNHIQSMNMAGVRF